MSKYLREVIKGYHGESGLFRRESFQLMMSPQTTGVREGIFWRLAASGHIGHGGGDPGITAGMWFDPVTDTGIVLHTNYDWLDQKDAANNTFQEILDALSSFAGGKPVRR